MKNIIILIVLIITTISCKAQVGPVESGQKILPLRQLINYIDNENGYPNDITYIKDVENDLGKFVGIWKGIYDNKSYEFRIVKYTEPYFSSIKQDILLIRYKIKNGAILIEDTTSLPESNDLIIKGDYLENTNSYVLTYVGKEGECGQSGDLFIKISNSIGTELKVTLAPDGDWLISNDCPKGEAKQVFPITTPLILTKQ